MDERSVWSNALRDIMEIIPLPRLLHALPETSTREIRKQAILMARRDALWGHQPGPIQPAKVQQYQFNYHLSSVAILSGGAHLVLMRSDGTLYLHRTGDLSGPPIVTTTRSHNADGIPELLISHLSCGNSLVVTYLHIRSVIRMVLMQNVLIHLEATETKPNTASIMLTNVSHQYDY